MLLTVVAWIVAFAATAFAYVLGFANGMKTAPSRSVRGALLAGAVPLGALALATYVVAGRWAHAGVGSALLRGGVPLSVGLLGVLLALDWLPRRSRGAGVFERQIATRPDGRGTKDTANNIRRSREFVVNVATEDTMELMHQSAQEFAPDVSETERLGIPLLPSRHVRPPRIALSPVQMECRLDQAIVLGRGIKDPRINALVTVTGAKMASDLRDVTAYVSILGDEAQKKSTLEGL